jgi:hypothetical protein
MDRAEQIAHRFHSLLAAACLAFTPCAAHAAAPWTEPAVVQGSDANYALLPRVFATGSQSTLVWLRDPSAGCSDPCGASATFASTLSGVSPGPRRFLLPDSNSEEIGATRNRLIAVQPPTYGAKMAAQVRTGPAGGALGSVQTLGPASDYVDAALGTSTDAAAVALMVAGDKAKSARIFVSIAPHAKRFGKPTLLYTDRSKQIVALAAGMNKRGDVFVAWSRGAETVSAPIEGRFRYASGRLGKVRRLGSGSVWFSRLHVALAGDRRAIVTWVDQELAADGPGALTQGKLKAAVVTAAGRVREQVLQAFPGAEEPNDFSAMFGSDGTGIAAWTGPRTARFARLRHDRFGAPADLGPVNSSQDRVFGLTAGPQGRSLAVWSAGPEVRAAVIPKNGRPAGDETVVARADEAASGFDPVTGNPFVAFAATGDDGTSRIAISERGAQ